MLLEALSATAEPGLFADLDLVVGERPHALVADERVLALHDPGLDGERHPVPSGEEAKRIEVVRGLWDDLRIGRDGAIVALGGGTTTDLAGFVAATYLRGVPWIAVPTTLVGQVDAAIGGKTGIDVEAGKNLAGAFHFPESVVIDPALLETLPEAERRQGMAEVVKTGLLAGRPLWELPEDEHRPRLRRVQGVGRPLGPVRGGPARDPQSRAHVRARARDRLGLRAGARRCGRARAAGRAAALRPADGRGRGGARPGAGAGRSRRGLGGAGARQEGARRHAEARAPGRTGRAALRRRAPGGRDPRGARRSHRGLTRPGPGRGKPAHFRHRHGTTSPVPSIAGGLAPPWGHVGARCGPWPKPHEPSVSEH